ncbi:MAG: hypothetical protein DME49_02365 [Verrucomicrobia bacterium]|nr:MAG: hypothetical protein DME49_02365 [Verrucomicrobiota bacterium]PYL37131.1 MAG: hypothetical protein DMF34_11505 [Verrucomicrobiota bacterium]PYL56875.1 MAG: hypothetical protein DMF30_08370 [Verrucomicrobiota bacterium]
MLLNDSDFLISLPLRFRQTRRPPAETRNETRTKSAIVNCRSCTGAEMISNFASDLGCGLN